MKHLFFLLLFISAITLAGCNNGDTGGGALYTITLNDDGQGTARATIGDNSVVEAKEGAIITLVATADEGYVFDEWTTESGVAFGNARATPTTFVMPAADIVITARFIDQNTITLTDDGRGSASATIDGQVATFAPEGARVTLTAVADEGYSFDRWVARSGNVEFADNTAATTTFSMPADDVVIRAEFVEDADFDVFAKMIDATFKSHCAMFDSNLDGRLSLSEAAAITVIDVFFRDITSLAGIEFFRNLERLVCGNNFITSLDLSRNTKLYHLACDNNLLPTLDVSNNTELIELRCFANELTSLDLSKNVKLENLWCTYNSLTSLDVSNNTALKILHCWENRITSLDLTNNRALTELHCYNNGVLSSIDVSQCAALKILHCYNNSLSSLDLSGNAALTTLNCNSNRLTSLDVSNNPALGMLYCFNNDLETLDMSNNTALAILYCYNNDLTSLDLSGKTALMDLYCYNNRMPALDVSDMRVFYGSFNAYCGMQTSDGTTPLTLLLSMTEEQKVWWNNRLADYTDFDGVRLNDNVVVVD